MPSPQANILIVLCVALIATALDVILGLLEAARIGEPITWQKFPQFLLSTVLPYIAPLTVIGVIQSWTTQVLTGSPLWSQSMAVTFYGGALAFAGKVANDVIVKLIHIVAGAASSPAGAPQHG